MGSLLEIAYLNGVPVKWQGMELGFTMRCMGSEAGTHACY